MEILKFPNSILFTPCQEVTDFGTHLKNTLEEMWQTMIAHGGLGLAANQVGLNQKMFVMSGPNDEKLFIVNPVIIKKSLVPAMIKEGCLSAPGEFLVINNRAQWVQIGYQDENGFYKEKVLHEIHSVCAQHEMEHLEGKTYLKSLTLPKSIRKVLSKKWKLK